MKSDPFWFNDIKILYNEERLTEFFPNKHMTHSEKLNALLRFAVYASAILILYYRNYNLLILPIFAAGVTLYIHKFNLLPEMSDEQMKDRDILKLAEKDECKVPTKDNPFMNTLIHELNDGPKKPNCDIDKKEVKEEMKNHFNYNLYKDVSDIYDKNNSQRQFYTMPQTTEYGVKAGDSVSFAKWLYELPRPTCKEDTTECTNSNSFFHNDLRYQKHQLLGDEAEPPY